MGRDQVVVLFNAARGSRRDCSRQERKVRVQRKAATRTEGSGTGKKDLIRRCVSDVTNGTLYQLASDEEEEGQTGWS